MHTVKILGLIFIVLSCTLIGFNRAIALKRRAEKLNKINISLSRLATLIKNQAGERDKLLNLCFEKDNFEIDNNKIVIDNSFLKKDDVALFNEFLDGIGMLDSESEYNRTLNYISLFEKQFEEAQKDYRERSKLYNSLGFLTGVSICIFLI